MKKLTGTLIALLLSLSLFAQFPEAVIYQVQDMLRVGLEKDVYPQDYVSEARNHNEIIKKLSVNNPQKVNHTAQSFEIAGICYNISSTNTVEVASRNQQYYDSIIIPTSITYNTKHYSVTSIGKDAFRDCFFLTSVTIPNSVTDIGENAFCNCLGLMTVNIPFSVINIGDGAFYACQSLKSVTIPNSVKSIGNNVFYACINLMSITISSSLTSIGGWAFYNCRSLSTITIPASVTSIGRQAFAGCNVLSSISVDANNLYYSSVEGVLYSKDQTSLLRYPMGIVETNFNIPSSVTNLGEFAFWRCIGLMSVTIPNTVINIRNSAFAYCSSLTSVLIPNSVNNIGDGAFEDCSSLTSVLIPNSVTSIGKNAFSFCPALNSITVEASNQHYSSIDGILYNKDKTNLFIYPAGKTATDFTIPSFVKNIGVSAFSSCINLKSVTIPNSVTSIGSSAFSYCRGLTSLFIPNSVINIDDYAFWGCSSLMKLSVDRTTPPLVQLNTFGWQFDKQNCVLEVPIGASTLYKATAYWSEFNIINEVNFSSHTEEYASNNIKIYTNDKQLIVDGTENNGSVQVYTPSGILLHNIKSFGGKIIVPVWKNAVYVVKTAGQTTKVLVP